MKITKESPYGAVNITQEEGELVVINASSDLGAFWGQGYASAHLRLWQMDLTRRVAAGRLCEILGSGARSTDMFQRRLGLRALAEREAERVKQAHLKTGVEELQSLQIKAYVEGINDALKTLKGLPIECRLLRYKPEPFTEVDVYATAQLKYFINSAWQYEMFHTNLLKRINAKQAHQLFKTFSEAGTAISPLPYRTADERTTMAEEALQAGLEGLRMLGLSSPDTGSNVFVVNGKRSATGAALLASDPHMGQVNPGYCLLCHLKSDEGLDVIGANFPGAPGIVVGRNPEIAWGMVGIMADNQDLFWAEVDWEKQLVKGEGGWLPLEKVEQQLLIKGQAPATVTTYGFTQGRLLQSNDTHALFLRWPALDMPLGDIVLYDLAKSRNWEEFRASLKNVHNSPMMVGYADIQGDIGLQVTGLFPKRKESAESLHLGSLIQSLEKPASPWVGYRAFEELPSSYNPPEGYLIYANQYSETLFQNHAPLSNRWHPPTRANRIKELIEQHPQLTHELMMQIQDDKRDGFARDTLAYLKNHLDEGALTEPFILEGWAGETQEVDKNLFFERWVYLLAHEVFGKTLRSKSFALYTDFWPSYRWCTLDVLRHSLPDWLNDQQKEAYEKDPEGYRKELVSRAYKKALKDQRAPPMAAFSHTIKQSALLAWLFTGRAAYTGGGRETVHATRQNVDFLTASQSDLQKADKQKPFSFGPAFKLVSELDEKASIWYMTNSPAKGSPFFWSFNRNLKRWLKGVRVTKVLKSHQLSHDNIFFNRLTHCLKPFIRW